MIQLLLLQKQHETDQRRWLSGFTSSLAFYGFIFKYQIKEINNNTQKTKINHINYDHELHAHGSNLCPWTNLGVTMHYIPFSLILSVTQKYHSVRWKYELWTKITVMKPLCASKSAKINSNNGGTIELCKILKTLDCWDDSKIYIFLNPTKHCLIIYLGQEDKMQLLYLAKTKRK